MKIVKEWPFIVRDSTWEKMRRLKNKSMRPRIAVKNVLSDQSKDGSIDRHSVPDLYSMALGCYAWRQTHHALGREIWRHGLEVTKNFARRCDDCDYQTFDGEETVCPHCQKVMRFPDDKDEMFLKRLINRANYNHKSLIDISQEGELDINILDQVYYVLQKKYSVLRKTGKIIDKELQEVVHVPPQNVIPVEDDFGLMGGQLGVCIRCRAKKYKNNKPYHPVQLQDNIENHQCPNCGSKLYDVHYIIKERGISEEKFYIEGEIIDASYRLPNHETKSAYPIYTLLPHISILNAQNRLEEDTYGKQRGPKGFIAVPGIGKQKLLQKQRKILAKLKRSPNYIPWVHYNPSSGKGKPEYVQALPTSREMQSLEHRREHARIIASFYGVTPIFQSDPTAGGGLNNEGLQLSVTDRAVHSQHKFWEEKVYRPLAEYAGITDYHIEFEAWEEDDNIAILERYKKVVEMAKTLSEVPGDISMTFDGDEVEDLSGTVKGAEEGGNGGGWSFDPPTKSLNKAKYDSIEEAMRARQSEEEAMVEDAKEKIWGLKKRQEYLAEEMKADFRRSMKRFVRRFRARDDKAEAKRKIDEAVDRYYQRMKRKLIGDKKNEGLIKEIYKLGSEQAKRDINIDIGFTGADESILQMLENAKSPRGILRSLRNWTQRQVNRIYNEIKKLYEKEEGFTNKELKDKILKEDKSMTDYEAMRYAKTTAQLIATQARAKGYERDPLKDMYEYYFLGADDGDTCDDCMEVMRGNPYPSLQALKDAIKKHSAFASSEIAHPQCRHNISRKAKPTKKSALQTSRKILHDQYINKSLNNKSLSAIQFPDGWSRRDVRKWLEYFSFNKTFSTSLKSMDGWRVERKDIEKMIGTETGQKIGNIKLIYK